jgi:methionyl-tRNA formyltransferase
VVEAWEHSQNISMTQPLNLIFAGTPQFAVPTLEKLVEAGFHIPLVVTQPDRPRGRGMELTATPVKQCALKLNLPITQPDRIKNNDDFRSQLAELKADAIIVVGYGRIIPQWMIELPPLGNLNVHASLLPKYRGAAPIQWAIAQGESITGVTTMLIDAGLDTGEILLQRECSISPEDNAETMAPKLASLGADLMLDTLAGLQSKTLQSRPQDHAQATLAPILKKEDGRIDFHRSAIEIWNRLRGFQPWPGAFTTFRRKSLHVWSAQPATVNIPLGTIRISDGHLLVGCGSHTALELSEVQLEGKKRMSATDFVNGYRPKDGETLGV